MSMLFEASSMENEASNVGVGQGGDWIDPDDTNIILEEDDLLVGDGDY